jgi:tetratricopeptide (TPR) repeat protein
MNTAPVDPREDSTSEPEGQSFEADVERAIRAYAKAGEAGDTEEALQAALSAFEMVASEAARNPTPDLILAQDADDQERAGDWPAAEASYRKLIEMSNESGTPGLTAKPQIELSRLLQLQGRLDEAWELAQAATASARVSELSPLIAMTLDNQAVCALERGDACHALEASSEAVDVLEPGRLFSHMRARALIRRAECSLACAEARSAEKDLITSRKLLDEELNPALLPGTVWVWSKWWQVRARLDLETGNLSQAAEALSKGIQYRRQGIEAQCHTSPHAALALAKDLEALGDVAQRRGDFDAARDAALEAKLLREQSH